MKNSANLLSTRRLPVGIPALCALLALVLSALPPAARAQAPNLTILHSFSALPDGLNPQAALIQGADGNFYGTTPNGGNFGHGTVFRVTPAGAATTLYSFTGANGDGGTPRAALVQGTNGNFYGTTSNGGIYNGGVGGGTVFQMTPAG